MHCHSKGKKGCKARCCKIGLLVVVGIAALGGVVMLLWNWLVPSLFLGAQPVSYVQALGLLLLSKILFGGFRGGCPGRWHRRIHERRERWESMSPEEREQLKGKLGSWCCKPEKGDGGTAAEVSKADE